LRDLERLLDLERRVLEFDFDLLDDLFLRFVLEFDLVLVLLLEMDLLADFRRLRDLERFLDRDLDLRDRDLDLRDRDLDLRDRDLDLRDRDLDLCDRDLDLRDRDLDLRDRDLDLDFDFLLRLLERESLRLLRDLETLLDFVLEPDLVFIFEIDLLVDLRRLRIPCFRCFESRSTKCVKYS